MRLLHGFENALERQIGAILLNQWDPIGIKDEPSAADEYNSYVLSITRMIRARRSIDQLSEWLLEIETKLMGLKGNPIRARAVAAKFSALGS